jgi:hypothetical protein
MSLYHLDLKISKSYHDGWFIQIGLPWAMKSLGQRGKPTRHATFDADTEANVRATALIYLVENKLVTL